MNTPRDLPNVLPAKSSALPPGLYVVATPIGNLEDITLRAVRVLREVDLIACEDTRHTQKLLNHFDIKKPTQSYHQHNEAARAQELADSIAAGRSVALVSDAGMPGISDPGERVIRAVLDRELNVVVIPGASALVTALVASGLPTESFRFVGFLPSRSGERRTALEALRDTKETLVFYEAPHRIREMLSDLQLMFGPTRRVAIARELTKVHEELLRGSIAEVCLGMSKREAPKGEMTVVVAGSTEEKSAEVSGKNLVERMRELLASGDMNEKDALKQIAKEFGVPKSEAYREWQRGKKRPKP